MAIKLLKQDQLPQAAAFLDKDYDVHALIAEDLKDEQIRVYGQYSSAELTALLIVYPEKIYFCSSVIPPDIVAFIPFIQKTGIRRIFGKRELIETFKKIVKTEIESDSVMMKYDNKAAGSVSGEVCKITSLEECRRLYHLFMQVEEYKMAGPTEAFLPVNSMKASSLESLVCITSRKMARWQQLQEFIQNTKRLLLLPA